MHALAEEECFFLGHLDSNKTVLEYGFGKSTLKIAPLVKSIISVEHQINWYHEYAEYAPLNCKVLFKPPNQPFEEGGEDGTYEQFKDYIDSPIEFAPFDIIYIDGRARVACASVCKKLGHKDSIVFIHDYSRSEYKGCEEYLIQVGQIVNMSKFRIKYD